MTTLEKMFLADKKNQIAFRILSDEREKRRAENARKEIAWMRKVKEAENAKTK